MSNGLQAALQHISLSGELDFEVRSYSGRGMYGKTCVAIVGDNLNLIEIGFILGNEYNDTVNVSEVTNCRSDSMGLGKVIYWPDVPFDESIVEEPSEDNEIVEDEY